MAAPFIALGLKGADALVDKHFHKIPDDYMHANKYHPKNLPNPLKSSKERKGDQSPSQDQDDNDRAVSPSPEYDDSDDSENINSPSDIPRHSGAFPMDGNNTNVRGVPQQYSTAPPQVRPEYMPPPPIGHVYPPAPQQPNNQFPPHSAYNQFPPPPRDDRYPPSPPSTAETAIYERRRRSGDRGHRLRSGGQDRNSEDDRRSRQPRTHRRSSSLDRAYNEHVTYINSDNDRDVDGQMDVSRSSRRPKNATRRSSSYQPSRNNEMRRYTGIDEDASEVSSVTRRPQTSSNNRDFRGYDDEDIYRSRNTRRPRMVTRRSSSFHGRDSDRNSYPPSSLRDARRPRRDSVGSGSKRSSGRDFEDNRPNTAERENGQFFTKSKEGLLSGALGAIVGGWAAQRAQRSGSSRDGRRGSRAPRKGKEDDTVLTLLGAAVGGLAVNAAVEHMEQGKMKKERVEKGKKDSRVYEWDDGYA